MKKVLLALSLILVAAASFAAGLKNSVTWDNIRRHPAPLPVLGELVPVPSELGRDSYWSVGSETLDRDFAVFDNYIQYMQETGVGYARLQSGWAKSEPKRGKYNFEWLDKQVDGLIANGIKPWICLCYGNPAYTDLGYDLNAGIFEDGPVMDGWLRYVREVAGRYKGKVTMYEVWNEPDGAKGPDGKPGTNWNEYANLYIRTAAAVKEVDPDVKLAALGAFSIRNKYIGNVLDVIVERGAANLLEYVTYHGYNPNPDAIRPFVEKLVNDVQAVNPAIKVLQGECGCPAQLEYGHALNGREWTEYSQAKWDLRSTMMNFTCGIPSSVFTMVDLNYGWMLQSFGLIRQNGNKEPVYKRPKFYAVQHLTSLITPDYKADNNVKFNRISTAKPVTLCGMEKNGAKVGYVLWYSADVPCSSLERELVDFEIADAELKDPVYVDMLSGYVHDISRNIEKTDTGISFKGVPMWDSPIVIMERSEVNFK